jgi:hypothetical protein
MILSTCCYVKENAGISFDELHIGVGPHQGGAFASGACPCPEVCFGSWPRENAEIEFANGNFVSTSINLKNKSAGDGCRDKTIEKTILRAFRARTFSRSQGQEATSLSILSMSPISSIVLQNS